MALQTNVEMRERLVYRVSLLKGVEASSRAQKKHFGACSSSGTFVSSSNAFWKKKISPPARASASRSSILGSRFFCRPEVHKEKGQQKKRSIIIHTLLVRVSKRESF